MGYIIVLTADAARILKGNYVLTYNKETEVKFDVEEVVVKEIKFKETDKAILQSTKTKAKVGYQVFDQFGNDITSTIPTTDLNVVSNVDADLTTEKGKVTFTKSADFVPNFDKISATIVYKNNGVNVSGLFTVSDEAKVWAVEYKGLYSVDKKAIVESISESDDVTKFFILFDVKDQYGNPAPLDATTKASLNVILLGATKLNKVADSVTPHSQKVGNDEYLAYQITPATGHNFGEVDVMVICLNNGVKTTGKFNVTHKIKVKTFSVREGAKALYANQKAEIEFEALYMNDQPITNLDVLKKFETKIQASPAATFEFNKDEKTGKITLTVEPTVIPTGIIAETRASYSVVVTGTTDAYKFFNNTLTVNNKKTPVALVGIKSDATIGVLAGDNLSIGLDALRFQDQFGAEMSAKEIADLYTTEYSVVAQVFAEDGKTATDKFAAIVSTGYPADLSAAGASITLNTANVVTTPEKILDVKAAEISKKGNAKVTVTVTGTSIKAEDSKHTFVIKNIALSDVTKFEVKTPDLVPASDIKPPVTGDYVPEGFGYFEGAKIKLTNKDFVVFEGAEVSDNKVGLPRIEEKTIKEGDTKSVDYKVIINDGKATEVKGTYTASKAVSVVKEAKYTATDSHTTDNYTKGFSWDQLTIKIGSDKTNSIATSFTVKDQYGQTSAAKPYVTFMIKNEDAKKATVEHNGRNDATLKLDASAGTETLTVGIKLVFPNTSYVYEGSIKVQKP